MAHRLQGRWLPGLDSAERIRRRSGYRCHDNIPFIINVLRASWVCTAALMRCDIAQRWAMRWIPALARGHTLSCTLRAPVIQQCDDVLRWGRAGGGHCIIGTGPMLGPFSDQS